MDDALEQALHETGLISAVRGEVAFAQPVSIVTVRREFIDIHKEPAPEGKREGDERNPSPLQPFLEQMASDKEKREKGTAPDRSAGREWLPAFYQVQRSTEQQSRRAAQAR